MSTQSIQIEIKTRRDGTRYFDFDGEIFNVDHNGRWQSEGLTFMGQPTFQEGHLSGLMVGADPDAPGIKNHPIFQDSWAMATYGGGCNRIKYTPRETVLEMFNNGQLVKNDQGVIVKE